ncbi:hypothetical protein JM83_2622 [Gillisia sp. Hel_I_86]|uniref:hypothetical protein n=1 Tax=Gillisia sp. Hel_I_86 TaxID=1249981 RepID=UPI0011999143|nr:hypothetical protein [Gillisia sp. Hel_I_86]TVZ27572.1 hypothetical protein JM83_2622 [Gillisia sp. Hel_I_86]
MKAVPIPRKNEVHIVGILLCFLFISCSSTNLVEQYTNPALQNLKIKKVLVIGMTPDIEVRRIFEKKVADEFYKRDVIAVESIDFFEKSFAENQKSEEQLNQIQEQLIEANFDAVLLAKVTGQEEKVGVAQAYRDFLRDFNSFTDYYYYNQEIYGSQESENYVLYHTETALYCLCPATERQVLWKATIDIVDTERLVKNINDYIKVLFKSLKDGRVLLK